ncbi:STAS domain-containing protein [Streptomyces sp. XY332]|uniref:STAS domain-containing protein n=1 Tax=Streptomyces sp. XY332 TaxID=1415561 RepID=UPI00099E17B3|nr:STAS domain-containing protein [Streptomyces sp. XY332]
MSPARQGATTVRSEEALATVRVEPDGAGGALIVLAGEIDQDCAAEVQDVLISALGACPAGVVLDLSGVTFCDCSFLNVLLHARLRAGVGVDRDRRFRIRSMSARVARLLALTGTLAYFPHGNGPRPHPDGNGPGPYPAEAVSSRAGRPDGRRGGLRR